MRTIEVIFLSASVLTLATGLIIVAINPWRLINRSYLIAATLSALWLFCIFLAIHSGLRGEQQNARFWVRASNAFSAFLPWSYSLVKFAITNTEPLVRVFRRSWPWFLAGCILGILACSDSFILPGSTQARPMRGVAYSTYVAVLTVSCLLILSDAWRKLRVCTGVRLLELKFFVINICLGTLVILTSFVTSHLFGIAILRYIGPYVFLASFGLTIWAICYHRIFDARQVFATLGRRLSTLVVLASCIQITDSYLTDTLTEPLALMTSACCGGLLATYWDRKVSRWLRLDAKQLLAGPRAQIIELGRQETDVDKLTRKFETFLGGWCQAESVSIHATDSSKPPSLILKTADYRNTFPLLRQTGYITPEDLARRRPDKEITLCRFLLAGHDLAALIAVPRDSLIPSCLVAFGPKRSLRPYTYPDIQLLIELVELMDNILTQARSAARSAQIEKMEATAMISRGLAHDLNNITTPISSFLLHMENRIAVGTSESEVLAAAKHSITVMQDYIREGLFFARQYAPDFQRLSMNELLTSTVKLTQTRAQTRGVHVVIDHMSDTTLVADRALMLRLMQNLVFNGIDATPRGGRVALSADLAEDGLAVFSVTDQGPGVPIELMDRVFEPYFTTKNTGDDIRGLGLGLAISLKISGLHGGKLRVGKASCGGAVFTFALPTCPANPITA